MSMWQEAVDMAWQWMSGFYTWRKGLLSGLFILCVFGLWLMYGSVEEISKRINPQPCNNSEAKDILTEICSLYINKEVIGNLCRPLCIDNQIQFNKCLNFRLGKHVSQVQCSEFCISQQTVPAVIKLFPIRASELRDHMRSIDREVLLRINTPNNLTHVNIHDYTITSASLSITTAELLEAEYGFHAREGQDVLMLLWGEDYSSQFQGPKTNLLFARSFWSLARQNEYRVSSTFREWDIFPKIYGTCGPLYLVEHAPSLIAFDKPFPFLSLSFPPWQARAKLAIEILHLVQETDNMDNALHLCDIKAHHFGLTSDMKMRYIDSDTVFVEKTLLRDLAAPKCEKHEDCAFFDCQGWCEKAIKKCLPIRTNNNLQTVCAKVFRGPALSAYSGLLTTPPRSVAAKLTNLVNSCADDVTSKKGDVELRLPDPEMSAALQRYLLESLNADAVL